MQDIYYSGLDLAADQEMIDFINQIKSDDRFELVKEPEHVLVHEMKFDGQKRDDYGKFYDSYKEVGTHEGYYWHYFYFQCKRTGIVYNVNKAEWYPFEGKWHVRIGRNIWKGEFENLEKWA